MAGRRLGTSGQRHLTLEERVNIAEGEDSLSGTDDGLDIIPMSKSTAPAQDVSFDEYMDELGLNKPDAVEISSDDAGGASSNKKPRARGERVAFTDDEDSDEAFKQFQQRKTIKRKQEAAQRAKTKKRADKNSMVGRTSKTVLDSKKRRDVRHYDDPSDDDEALMESTLPEYVRSRRVAWDRKRQNLGDNGLQFPPDYEDVYFSDDERLESLKERPALSEFMQPRAPYEDIELPASYGIIPAPIAQFLRKYQVEGVEFLHELSCTREAAFLATTWAWEKRFRSLHS